MGIACTNFCVGPVLVLWGALDPEGGHSALGLNDRRSFYTACHSTLRHQYEDEARKVMIYFKFYALYNQVFIESLLKSSINVNRKFVLVGGTARVNLTWRVLLHSLF